MTKTEAIRRASRDFKKASYNLSHAKSKPGVNEVELENLQKRFEYAQTVFNCLYSVNERSCFFHGE